MGIIKNLWPPWFLSFARPNGRQGPIKSSNLRSPHPTPTPPKGPGFWGFLDPKPGFSRSRRFDLQNQNPNHRHPKTQNSTDTHRPKHPLIHNWSPLRVWPDQTTIGPYRYHRSSMKLRWTPKKGQKTPLRNGFFGWFQPNAGRLQKNTPFLRFFA